MLHLNFDRDILCGTIWKGHWWAQDGLLDNYIEVKTLPGLRVVDLNTMATAYKLSFFYKITYSALLTWCIEILKVNYKKLESLNLKEIWFILLFKALFENNITLTTAY